MNLTEHPSKEELTCPNCGFTIPEIDCEKTTCCVNCDTEWKYDMEGNLIEVEEDDEIYSDR